MEQKEKHEDADSDWNTGIGVRRKANLESRGRRDTTCGRARTTYGKWLSRQLDADRGLYPRWEGTIFVL